jgi:hypothetical protein
MSPFRYQSVLQMTVVFILQNITVFWQSFLIKLWRRLDLKVHEHSMFLQNFGAYPQVRVVSHPRGPTPVIHTAAKTTNLRYLTDLLPTTQIRVSVMLVFLVAVK